MNAPSNIKSVLQGELVKVGDAIALVLPPEALRELGVRLGGQVDLVEQNGDLLLRRHVPTFEEQMAVAREIMDRDHDILAALAK